jgi:hypothetical protein
MLSSDFLIKGYRNQSCSTLLSALPFRTLWLNMKGLQNMETFPQASLHYDLQNEPAKLQKSKCFHPACEINI